MIGTKVRKIRVIKGISQDFVADQLNISQKHYSRMEQGDSEIDAIKLDEISKILEVTPEQIESFDESLVFNNCSNGNFGNNGTYYAFSEKERELYESKIKHLEEEVQFLRDQLESK